VSKIREFVMAEPLCDNHEHQNGFAGLDGRKHKLDYREFVGYAGADLATAGGVGGMPAPQEKLSVKQFFDLWASVRTTGYGQATELASKAVLGLDYTAENAEAITAALAKFTAGKKARTLYKNLLAKAGIRWALNDCCWDSPTKLHFFDGSEHPEGYVQVLRYDAVLMVGSRDQVEGFERVFERPIQRLSDLDAALDDYAEKARLAGKLGGMKSALPYSRRVDFEQSSFADAERAFEAMMQNRQVELRPLHDYLFHRFVQRSREFGLPVQLHTGYLAGNWGNPGQGNPELLVPIFRRYRGVRFDVFHAGWPYSEVAGAIGKAFPNVYLDMCWAWTMNPAQMERILSEWLSAVPHNKIFGYGGDTGSPFPMVGYALQARQGIANVLERKVESGEYDLETAKRVARRIMHENAQEVYALA
jgi:hypothetical protein